MISLDPVDSSVPFLGGQGPVVSKCAAYLALKIQKEESRGHRDFALAATPMMVAEEEKEAVAVSPGDLA